MPTPDYRDQVSIPYHPSDEELAAYSAYQCDRIINGLWAIPGHCRQCDGVIDASRLVSKYNAPNTTLVPVLDEDTSYAIVG